MRRVVGFSLSDHKAMACVDAWKKVKHVNVINLREVFTTRDFQDHSLVFVYDYHPRAETLLSRHFTQGQQGFVPEPLLWSYIIQITSALRAIHGCGIACRVVRPSKILLFGGSQIKISSTCILDVLQYGEGQTSPAAITHFQQEDLFCLGTLILALACGSLSAISREAMPQSMAHVSARYSEDVFTVIRYAQLAPPRAVYSMPPVSSAPGSSAAATAAARRPAPASESSGQQHMHIPGGARSARATRYR